MIIGEAPGYEEIQKGVPFVGASGYELDKMLADAGISRSQCFVTNVCSERPPGNDISLWVSRNKGQPSTPGDWTNIDGLWVHRPVAEGLQRLVEEIRLVAPKLIIGLGNLALWSQVRKWGISDWRGSQFQLANGALFLPTYHPAAILREYSWRFAAVHDLRRAKRMLDEGYHYPDYSFLVRPSFPAVMDRIEKLISQAEIGPLPLAVDIETRWGYIACLGLAWDKLNAICIPFMCTENKAGYWLAEEEAAIVHSLYRLLTHRNVRCIGQNFLYDVQYIYRHWHFLPRFGSDTMLAHHVVFPGLPKGLDFLSSLYCHFNVFWKAESKDWHKSMQEDILWTYNCKDCVITFECHEEIQSAIRSLGLEGPYEQQMALWSCALRLMIRGIRVNEVRRKEIRKQLEDAIAEGEGELTHILGHPINFRSPDQLKKLFFSDLAQKVILNRTTKKPTTNDDALLMLMQREPLLKPVITRIQQLRSLGVFLSTFVNAKADEYDGRIRSMFNPAGTVTFRFSSAQDAFGSGMNLENIPKGDEE